MTLAGVLAGAAQSHTVVDGAVVADLGGLTKDDAHTVVDEQALADLGTRVDLDARFVAAMLADPPGQEKVLVLIQPVCYPVIHQNMETRVEQNDLQHVARGGVFALDVACVLQ